MKKISILLLFAVFNTYSSCDLGVKPGCEGTNNSSGTGYEFEIPFTVSPAKDTFSIGDTITIESNFGDSLFNHLTKKYYQIGDLDFFIFIYIADLKTDPMIGSLNYDIFPVTGLTDEDPSSFGKEFFMKHEYKDFQHRYKVKIVMREKGYFGFSPSSYISLEKLSQSGQHITDCENEVVGLFYNTNNGDGNFYMKQFAADHHVIEWKNENIRKSGWYFFYVK